jgi:hypothetical protein
MMPYDDPKWRELYDACEILYDPRAALQHLEFGTRQRREVWDELFLKLHHQGRIDSASYAVVPELARIARSKCLKDWEVFALVACVEDCRHSSTNPPVPSWLEQSYFRAIRDLASYGCSIADQPWSREMARSILAVVAFANGLGSYGKVLSDFTDDELKELIDDYIGRE